MNFVEIYYKADMGGLLALRTLEATGHFVLTLEMSYTFTYMYGRVCACIGEFFKVKADSRPPFP